MKTANFPGRVNARRVGALYRMEHGAVRDIPSKLAPGRHAEYKDRARDIAALTARIVTDARNIRVKKSRGR